MKYKIKNLIQICLFIFALILSFSLIKSINKISSSNQKIIDATAKVNQLKKDHDALVKNLQIAKSPQFIESEARNKLGLAKTGEIVVVLPETDTLKNLAPKLEIEKDTLPDPNWKLWLKLFF